MIRFDTFLKLRTASTLVLPASLAALAPAQSGTLIQTGDTIAGAGTVIDVGEFAINDAGQWVAVVRTDQFPAPSAVLVRDGAVYAAPGGSLAGGAGPVFHSSQRTLDIDDAGRVLWATGSGTQVQALYVDATPYAVVGASTGVGELGASTTWLDIRTAVLDPAGSGTVLASAGYLSSAPLQGPGTGLFELAPGVSGGVQASLLVGEGDLLPGLGAIGDFWFEYPALQNELAWTRTGDRAFLVGDPAGAYRLVPGSSELEPIAFPGGQAPIFGTLWESFDDGAVALNDAGDAAYLGEFLEGLDTESMAAANGIAIAQTGAGLPDLGPFTLTELQTPNGTSRSFELTETGRVAWVGRWNAPDTTRNEALFLDQTIVLQKGVSQVGGVIVADLRAQASQFFGIAFDMDADGSHVTFRADLADGRFGLYRMQLAASSDSNPGCTPKLATLQSTPLAIEASSLTFILDGAQAPGAPAVVLISTSGATDCGLLLPGIGELQVGVAPGELLSVLGLENQGAIGVGQLQGLSPSLYLVGFPVHCQGAWLDPLSAVEPVRLSNQLILTAGFQT